MPETSPKPRRKASRPKPAASSASKRPEGRPSLYTDEIAEEICRRIAHGETLVAICRKDGMPDRTVVYDWLLKDKHAAFADNYARARELQLEHWGDEIVEVSDDGRNDWVTRQAGENEIKVADHDHIARSRLRVDTRKWLMAKRRPDLYGDKQQHEHTGKDGKDLMPPEASPAKMALAMLTILRAAKPEGEENG